MFLISVPELKSLKMYNKNRSSLSNTQISQICLIDVVSNNSVETYLDKKNELSIIFYLDRNLNVTHLSILFKLFTVKISN